MPPRTITNPDAAIKWYKDNYRTIGTSDYEIYEKLKNQYPSLDFVDNPYKLAEPKTSTPDKQTLQDNYNPGAIEKLFTMNLAGAYAGESEWWAEAYNKSIGGTIYEIMYGEKRFETKDIDSKWYDEVGQFFVGLVSPVDLITFYGSSGIGSLVSKGITHGPLKNMAVRGLSSLLGKTSFTKLASNRFVTKLAVGAGIESGFSLASFGAATGVLQDAAHQRSEILDPNNPKTEMDYVQLSYTAAKSGAHGLILGGMAGFATKGIMGPRFAQASMKSNPKLADKVTILTMNQAAQVVA